MAKRELTEEQKKFNEKLAAVVEEMQDEFNGCPLFEDREKGSLDELTGMEVTIEDIFPLNDYHCVVFSEIPEKFFLTGGALKDLCNNYEPQFVIGRTIIVQEMVKTKNKKDFRPIKVVS